MQAGVAPVAALQRPGRPLPCAPMEVTIDVEVAEEGRRQVAELMRSLRAYDVMKETNKVIVYDTQLPFKHAYFSLVEYGALRVAWGVGCVCVV